MDIIIGIVLGIIITMLLFIQDFMRCSTIVPGLLYSHLDSNLVVKVVEVTSRSVIYTAHNNTTCKMPIRAFSKVFKKVATR